MGKYKMGLATKASGLLVLKALTSRSCQKQISCQEPLANIVIEQVHECAPTLPVFRSRHLDTLVRANGSTCRRATDSSSTTSRKRTCSCTSPT